MRQEGKSRSTDESGEKMSENRARGFNRRLFLKGTAAVSLGTAATASLGTAVSGPWMTPAAAAEPAPMPPHGAELRGMDLVTQSPTTEGRFGFMFKNQPPHAASNEVLDLLGSAMEEQPVKGTAYIDPKTGQPGTPATVGNNENDASNENPNPLLTSGFTFVGQFVDHDITFDTTSLSEQESDPDATTNFRTPRYDLDAIYGRGPNTDPQFYDPNDRDKFLIEERPYSQIKGLVTTPATSQDIVYDVKPDVVWDVPRDSRRRGHHRRPPERPDTDHPPAPCGHADVPQQARGPLREAWNAAVGRVRVGSAPGPVALPVDRDPRVPPRHRGTDHVRLGVQGSPDRCPEDHPQVLQADESCWVAPSFRSSSLWPHTASATALPGPATPSGTSSTAPASLLGAVSSVPLFQDAAHRQQL